MPTINNSINISAPVEKVLCVRRRSKERSPSGL